VNRRWVIAKAEPALTQTLAERLCIAPALAQVLVNRGHRDLESAQRFLRPQLRQLRDPFELPDMTKAVTRLSAALAAQERIVIYGDYDADGITATALLTRVLRHVGGSVETFLPHRMDEGYGLSSDGIARCLRERRPQLLLAVDCGTTAVSEIAHLQSQGVDVIVLDHHEPSTQLPVCVALVNPKMGQASSLSAVGVAFKLAHALLKTNRQWEVDLREHLDLVAIGTVADVVPLAGDNRILVKAGLSRMMDTQKTGLRALLEVADVSGPLSPYHVGFRIAPRLNAAGRLADARTALELLLTDEAGRAGELAAVLDHHNAERQRVEEHILQEALAQATQHGEDRVLVLANENWHPGVIGIVASRLLRQFCRPVVILGAEGRGSGRSVPGFSLVQALHRCGLLLEHYGGHDLAAGLTVKEGQIEALRHRLNEETDEIPACELMVDALVRLEDLNFEFLHQMEMFEPCGANNPTPVFVATGLQLRGAASLLKDKHLKFRVSDGSATMEALWWGGGQNRLPNGEMDVALVPERNQYRGVESVQLVVRDVRPTPP